MLKKKWMAVTSENMRTCEVYIIMVGDKKVEKKNTST